MIGETILHYKILEKLGEGGMGEVFKARDIKLDRFVALKFLPSQLTASEDDKARFIREAKAASAMNHPNVCTIYSIEEYEKQLFIVMEFVEGKTLKDLVASHRNATLQQKQILDIGIQVAEGLAAAHEKGIVHRDIKPENIMVRKDGIVQIMDFGLAKLYKDSNVSRLTKAGTTMGTIGYMSPEQVQGLDVDHRTDIFSLGVVLYELFTGESPFKGVHETAIMYEIVNVDAPPLSTIKGNIDPELDRIILECLEKDKDERRQSAKELAKDLRRVKKSTGTRKSRIYNVDTTAVKTGTVKTEVLESSGAFSVELLNHKYDLTKLFKLKYIPWITTAVFLAAFIFSLMNKSKEPGSEFIKFRQLTEQSGQELYPDISPDGNYIIYTKAVNDIQHIFLQRIGGVNAIDLTKGSKYNNFQSSFSPDGQKIAFRSERDGGGIFVMGSTGESVHRLTDFGYNPVWSPGGKIILFATESIESPFNRNAASQLWTADVGTGKVQKFYDGDAVQPSWSPNGKWIAFWGLPKGTGKRVIYIIPSSGGKARMITNGKYIDWSPTWSPDDKYLYFSSDRGGSMNLWRVRIDKSSGKVLTGFEPVTTPSLFCEMAKFSSHGNKIIYVASETRDNIYKLNFDSKTEQVAGSPSAVILGTKRFLYPHVSPDNKLISAASTGQQEAIYIMHTDGSDILKLTNDNYKNRGPVWSPDGKSLAFYSDRSGSYETWEINRDGSNLRQLTKTSGVTMPLWFPDGKRIVTHSASKGFGTAIFKIDSTATNKLIFLPELNEKGRNFFGYSVSPDGKYIAGFGYSKYSGSFFGIYIYSLAENNYKELLPTGIGPVWYNDSKRLLYIDDNKFYVINTKNGKKHFVYDPHQELMPWMFAFSPDNKSIYYIKEEKESNVWMGYLK